MVSQNEAFIGYNHKIIYHFIRFISFVIAIFGYEFVKTKIVDLVPYDWTHFILPYIVLYVGAIYILPEIGFYIAKSVMEE